MRLTAKDVIYSDEIMPSGKPLNKCCCIKAMQLCRAALQRGKCHLVFTKPPENGLPPRSGKHHLHCLYIKKDEILEFSLSQGSQIYCMAPKLLGHTVYFVWPTICLGLMTDPCPAPAIWRQGQCTPMDKRHPHSPLAENQEESRVKRCNSSMLTGLGSLPRWFQPLLVLMMRLSDQCTNTQVALKMMRI